MRRSPIYIPNHFRVDDLPTLHAFIESNPFASVISVAEYEGSITAPIATHLPLYLERDHGSLGKLAGHLAGANPHWRSFRDDSPVLTTFTGPHAYVSPSWYEDPLNVPTWDYTAVHAYGNVCVVDDPQRVREILRRSIDAEEARLAHPWSTERLPTEYVARMMGGIVAFELEISRIEGTYKLSQNRSPHDQESVARELSCSSDPNARATGQLIHGLRKRAENKDDDS